MKDKFGNDIICESTGKICYTAREAGNAINGAKKCGHAHEIPKRKYFCEECGYYHLTHYSHYGNDNIKKRKFNKKLSNILLSEYKKLWRKEYYLLLSA